MTPERKQELRVTIAKMPWGQRNLMELFNEVERLETLLDESCRRLNIVGALKHASPRLRDYYGKLRSMQRKAGEPPCETWKG